MKNHSTLIKINLQKKKEFGSFRTYGVEKKRSASVKMLATMLFSCRSLWMQHCCASRFDIWNTPGVHYPKVYERLAEAKEINR